MKQWKHNIAFCVCWVTCPSKLYKYTECCTTMFYGKFFTSELEMKGFKIISTLMFSEFWHTANISVHAKKYYLHYCRLCHVNLRSTVYSYFVADFILPTLQESRLSLHETENTSICHLPFSLRYCAKFNLKLREHLICFTELCFLLNKSSTTLQHSCWNKVTVMWQTEEPVTRM
jgi:hypothetical protein